MFLGAIPAVPRHREEGLEEGVGYQPDLFGERVASGTDPPVAEDVEGRSPVELLLCSGGSALGGVDPGRPARRADEDQAGHGNSQPCGRLESLPLQGHRPHLRRPPQGHYPQARIQDVPHEEDPLRLDEGEEAWSMTLAADGPDYLPLRTFRDDDLLDPGSDPLIALIGALSTLHDKERIVARLLLRSLGPDWSAAHMDKAVRNPATERRDASYTYQTKPLQTDGIMMAVLGAAALGVLQGYFWMQDGETWKAVLLATGVVAGTIAAGSLPRPRPAVDQGEGLPHRLWRGASGHRHSAQRR